ncbi:MAG: acyl carrier protein [Undibacterium umbellatum]|uniref:acyl carrier protein n=1 Tax=Undibacterium umbellatum TaxID=2762300 RepID=UPI003BB66191
MLKNNELEKRLFSLLPKELKLPHEQLTRESQLLEIGFDSLAVIEFKFEVEEAFGIRFTQSDTPPVTLGEVFDQIEEAINMVPGKS